MHNLTVSQTLSPAQQISNLSIIESAVSGDMYNYWFNAEMIGNGGHASAAIYNAATLSSPSYWALANAVTSGVTAYVRRHQEWKDGAFKLKVHWTSDASGGTVRIGINISPVSVDNATPTFAAILPKTVSGPGTAGDTLVTEFIGSTLSTASAINKSNCGVVIGVRRAGVNAEDTNTGTVKILGVELIYSEIRHVVGEVFRG